MFPNTLLLLLIFVQGIYLQYLAFLENFDILKYATM